MIHENSDSKRMETIIRAAETLKLLELRDVYSAALALLGSAPAFCGNCVDLIDAELLKRGVTLPDDNQLLKKTN
jgi:hypothetical protein